MGDLGWLGSSKVARNVTIQYSTYDLFTVHRIGASFAPFWR